MRSILDMAPVFPCPSCEDTFTDLSNLKRHSKLHDNDWHHSCPQCNFKSKRNYVLNRHIEKYHSTHGMTENDIVVDPSMVEHHQKSDNNVVSLGNQFDKRLQLPHNFIYAGSSQSVSCCNKSLQCMNICF